MTIFGKEIFMNHQLNLRVETAISRIASPEKKREVRLKLESEIDTLLKSYDSETVLQKLGDASLVAEQFHTEYKLKYDGAKYKKLGYLSLICSVMFLVYAFVTLSRQEIDLAFGGVNNFSTMFSAGNGIAGSFICGLVFGVLGIALVCTSKKK